MEVCYVVWRERYCYNCHLISEIKRDIVKVFHHKNEAIGFVDTLTLDSYFDYFITEEELI